MHFPSFSSHSYAINSVYSLQEISNEFAQWKSATIQMNYHIAIDFQNYSVSYEYVYKKAEVWYTKATLCHQIYISKSSGILI